MTTAMRNSTAAKRGSTATARIRRKRRRRELGFRLGFPRDACGRGLRLFIARGEPRFACGSESEVAARRSPVRIGREVEDAPQWVGPTCVPTGQRLRAAEGERGALRRCCASWAAAGPRCEARLGRRGGRPTRALPFYFFF